MTFRTSTATHQQYVFALLLAACAAPGDRGAAAPGERRPGASCSIAGQVREASGEPVAGALVSLSAHFEPDTREPAYHERVSDTQGRFCFATLPPGRYGITASGGAAPGNAANSSAAYGGVLDIPPGPGPHGVELRRGAAGVSYTGVVRDDAGGPVAGARVLAAAFSEHEGEVYVARSDASGGYRLTLPPDQGYLLVADAAPRPRTSQQVDARSQVVDFRLEAAPAPRPDDDAITAALKRHAIALSAGSELDAASARALVKLVGDARFVAVGEAAHGAGDFTAWRRRVFQTLVQQAGFSVYAVETSWADARSVDDYVASGRGDATEVVRSLPFWKDATEETVELVRWMRAYNADASHTVPVHYIGFDPLSTRSVAELLDYLRRVDAAAARGAESALAPLAGADADETFGALPAADRERARQALIDIVATLEAHRREYVARSREPAWQHARRDARNIQRAAVAYASYADRDRQMFESLLEVIGEYPPSTKFLLGGANMHLAAQRHGLGYLGQLLRERFGSAYVAIGTAFGGGSIYAIDWSRGPSNSRADLHVDPAPLGTLDGDLGLTALPHFLLDLRSFDGSLDAPVAAWLHSPQLMHAIGGRYLGARECFESFTPARAFDGLLYLERVSPLHRLAAGQ